MRIATGVATGTLKDNDSGGELPKIFIADAMADEGSDLVFTVTQELPSVFDSEATWTITLPTAASSIGELCLADLADATVLASYGITSITSGSNTILIGRVQIPAGQLIGEIKIPTITDGVFEGDETLQITLSDPQNVRIATGVATGTLQDTGSGPGGELPKIFIADAVADEGSDLVFTVTQELPSVFDSRSDLDDHAANGSIVNR